MPFLWPTSRGCKKILIFIATFAYSRGLSMRRKNFRCRGLLLLFDWPTSRGIVFWNFFWKTPRRNAFSVAYLWGGINSKTTFFSKNLNFSPRGDLPVERLWKIFKIYCCFRYFSWLVYESDIKTKRRCFLWFWFAAPAMIQWLEELFPCDRVGGSKSPGLFFRTAVEGSHTKKSEFKGVIWPPFQKSHTISYKKE